MIYVVAPQLYDSVPVLQRGALNCHRLDGYIVCVTTEPDTAIARRLGTRTAPGR